MINQIQSSTSNVFAPLQSSARNFAITKPITQNQKKEQKERRNKNLGFIIAGAGITVGFGLLLVSQMFSKKPIFKLNRMSSGVDHEISKIEDNSVLSTAEKLSLGALKLYKSFLQRAKAMFTIATLKDLGVKKAFMQIPFVSKIEKPITAWFEKVSVKTSTMSYNSTHQKMENMFAMMRDIGGKLSASEKAKLNSKIGSAENKYWQGFSQSARQSRFAVAKDGMKGLDDKVWGKTYANPVDFIKSKKTYRQFLAEELASDAKKKLTNEVYKLKDKISLSKRNKSGATKRHLHDLGLYVDPRDKVSTSIMKKLKSHMENYGNTKHLRNSFPSSKVAKDLKSLNASVKKYGKYSEDELKEINKNITLLSEKLADNKQGEVQDIMDIAEKLHAQKKISDKEYKKLQKTVDKALLSFDKSTDLESDKLFDKVRDLKLGSAIHDALAFVGSTLVAGWFVGKADTKDDKISATLKYGIPVVGAVAIATICTVGLIASGPSFIIGGVSGIFINKLGEFIDNKRKKYQENPLTPAEAAQKIKDSIIPK